MSGRLLHKLAWPHLGRLLPLQQLLHTAGSTNSNTYAVISGNGVMLSSCMAHAAGCSKAMSWPLVLGKPQTTAAPKTQLLLELPFSYSLFTSSTNLSLPGASGKATAYVSSTSRASSSCLLCNCLFLANPDKGGGGMNCEWLEGAVLKQDAAAALQELCASGEVCECYVRLLGSCQ